MYIAPNTKSKKYLASRRDLRRGQLLSPPKLGDFHLREGSKVNFINERHRFSNLRDLGAEQVPVLIQRRDRRKMRQERGLIVE